MCVSNMCSNMWFEPQTSFQNFVPSGKVKVVESLKIKLKRHFSMTAKGWPVLFVILLGSGEFLLWENSEEARMALETWGGW